MFLFCSNPSSVPKSSAEQDKMCALVRVRSNEDPFVLDVRIEPLYHETDARPGNELSVWRRHPQSGEIAEAKLRWGLIPHWMKARPEVRPINARAETIADKRMFAEAYARRRCIVPMDVFYERDQNKKLHAFGAVDGNPFGVAGIWENWRNADGKWERTFCIITVPANELARREGHRPVTPIDGAGAVPAGGVRHSYLQAVWASSRPARDRTAGCLLHWRRRGSSRLHPAIPGSAAQAELG
jgi:putative SOS response-associated peptidase YedK